MGRQGRGVQRRIVTASPLDGGSLSSISSTPSPSGRGLLRRDRRHHSRQAAQLLVRGEGHRRRQAHLRSRLRRAGQARGGQHDLRPGEEAYQKGAKDRLRPGPDMPEQTLDRAWSDMPKKNRIYMPLAVEGGRQHFGIRAERRRAALARLAEQGPRARHPEGAVERR